MRLNNSTRLHQIIDLKHHLEVIGADDGSHLQDIKTFRGVKAGLCVLKYRTVIAVLGFRFGFRASHSLDHRGGRSEIELPRRNYITDYYEVRIYRKVK
jgi:hypothetical protein